MKYKYNKIVGIGGIGTGMLFHTDIDAILGRSESRLAELSGAKDYCKQHIVFHYISTLLSPDVKIYPIGFVGKDAYGDQLIQEIQGVGMDTTYLRVDSSLPTMLSICLQYPDKETCNFTASNSACNLVTPECVRDCLEQIGIDENTIVVAIPEVQVDSRVEMLKIGKEKGAYCVLSVPEAEADDFKSAEAFKYCDLVAVNHAEALMLAPGDEDDEALTKRLYEYLRGFNPEIMLLATLGQRGAYSVYRGNYEFIPSLSAKTVNTSGAGDACLGGTLAGLTRGLPFQKGCSDSVFGGSQILSAVELGTLCAGMAVETEDSIAQHVNRATILERISESGWKVTEEFL